MKKNIIIAAIAAASALLLSVSCQKENQPESQSGINGGANTFTATIEQGITKTTLTADYKVNWTTGDKININGKSYTASPKTDDATKADFTADDGEATAVDGKFKAIYPSTLYANGHFELPAIQTYSANGFNAPMYAESETQTLLFKNICAVLAIKVTSEDITSLKSIKVKSDKAMYGTFTVTDNKAVLSDDSDASKAVTLESASALTLDATGTTFYIAIPEQTYSYLKIYLSEDGTLYKRAMITKKTVGTISCNKIYNIDYETNAVQLYANGPYWSTMNIGATTPAGYGWYFSWGNTTGYVYDATNKWVKASDNTTKLGTDGSFIDSNYKNATVSGSGYKLKEDIPVEAKYDAAYANWGAAWKMPTGGSSGQFKNLNDNTTSAWTNDYNSTGVKGITFTGKTGTPDYSDIKLFFPAAGIGNNTSLNNEDPTGCYWSSSLNISSTSQAYYLYFNNLYDLFVNPTNYSVRYIGKPVRPVSD